MKVGIIGGGASGLISAIYASLKNDVTILEKNSKCGKKILLTGNGRCNFGHYPLEVSKYHSFNKDFLTDIISNENEEEIIDFFTKLGLVYENKNGYYYPFSNQASSILNILLNEVERRNILVKTDCNVINIIKKDDKFIVKTKDEDLEFDRVVMAVGGASAPKTGSDGSGYALLSNLGHHIIKPLPALVMLEGREKYFKLWNGVRSAVNVSLEVDNKKIKEEKGEIQLTSYGVSGICIFNLSRYVSRALDNNQKVTLKINFVPFLTSNDFNLYLSKLANISLKEILEGFLNYKLIDIILDKSRLSKDLLKNDMTFKDIETLYNVLTNFSLEITGVKDFNYSQVTTGGLDTLEVNPQTFESKIVKGLYIIGEVLDVDGDCGGYNLAFAFISGKRAGESIR